MNRQIDKQTKTDTQTNRQKEKQIFKQTWFFAFKESDTEKQTNPQTYADKKTVSHVTICLLLHDFHKRIFFKFARQND